MNDLKSSASLLQALVFSLLLLLPFHAFTQSEEAAPENSWSIQLQNGYSQTGLSTALAVGRHWKHWSVAGGVKFLPLGSFQYADLPYGGLFTVSREMARRLPFHSFVFANLEMAVTETYCPFTECETKRDFLNEFTMGYGFEIDLSEKWFLSNSISMGFYQELRYGYREEKRFSNLGFNGLLRLGLAYRLL